MKLTIAEAFTIKAAATKELNALLNGGGIDKWKQNSFDRWEAIAAKMESVICGEEYLDRNAELDQSQRCSY